MMSKESRDRLISVAVALLIVLVVWFGKWCASSLESSQSLFCGGMTCKMPNTVPVFLPNSFACVCLELAR